MDQHRHRRVRFYLINSSFFFFFFFFEQMAHYAPMHQSCPVCNKDIVEELLIPLYGNESDCSLLEKEMAAAAAVVLVVMVEMVVEMVIVAVMVKKRTYQRFHLDHKECTYLQIRRYE